MKEREELSVGGDEDYFGLGQYQLLQDSQSHGEHSSKERKLVDKKTSATRPAGIQFTEKQFFFALKNGQDVCSGKGEEQNASIIEHQYSDRKERLDYSVQTGRYMNASQYTDPHESEKGRDEAELEERHLDKLRQLTADDYRGKQKQEKPMDIARQFEADQKRFLEQETRAKDVDGTLKALAKIKDQIEPVWKMSQNELVDLLLQRIIYKNENMIAFDKPYGMVARRGRADQANLSVLLKTLQKAIFKQGESQKELILVHAPEKNATGCAIFATNDAIASELKAMFDDGRAEQTHVCITRSVPSMDRAKISIPLTVTTKCARGTAYTDRAIIVANSTVEKDNRARLKGETRVASRLSTHYKVISRAGAVAFVQCQLNQSITNQVRAHMGLIECPILGDSKYTHFCSSKPQRLPMETVSRLGIRSSKARQLPRFLHLQKIILPEVLSGQTLVIRAPIPQYFLYTLQKLRLIAK